MAYQLVLTLACLVLVAQHVTDSGASARGRWLVAALALTSFSVPAAWGLPAQITAILLQVSVCLFVLLRRAATAGSTWPMDSR